MKWPNLLLPVGSVEFLCFDANFLLFQRNVGTCLLLNLRKTHILITGLLDPKQMFREDCKYTFLCSIHRNVVESFFFCDVAMDGTEEYISMHIRRVYVSSPSLLSQQKILSQPLPLRTRDELQWISLQLIIYSQIVHGCIYRIF